MINIFSRKFSDSIGSSKCYIESVFFECRFRKQLWISASSIGFLGSAPWPFIDLVVRMVLEHFWRTNGIWPENAIGCWMSIQRIKTSISSINACGLYLCTWCTVNFGAFWETKNQFWKLMNSFMTSWKFVNLGSLSIYFMYVFMNLILKSSQVVIFFKPNTEKNKFGRNFWED